jgi:hypothetical protein
MKTSGSTFGKAAPGQSFGSSGRGWSSGFPGDELGSKEP